MRELVPHPTLRVFLLEDPGQWEIELKSGMIHAFEILPDCPKYIHASPDEIRGMRRNNGMGWVNRWASNFPHFIENEK